MSTPAQVITALQNQLKNSTALSYVNDEFILLGARQGMAQYPCILLEPLPNTEEFRNDQNVKVDIRYFIAVIGYIRITEPDKQIVGDTNTKGIADLENDIKKAISADETLGGIVIDTIIHTSDPDLQEWPVRSVAIEVEIFFRQDRTART